METNKIYQGDSLEVLKTFPDESVQTCVTSPPYFGLRDYGTGNWIGGDTACTHRRESKKSDKTITGHKNFTEMLGVGDAIQKSVCHYCGAVREDLQIGLEETPEAYVQKLVEVFREVRRVLRNDGTLWLNLGDSYASYRDGKATPDTTRGKETGTLVPKGSAKNRMASTFAGTNIKHKDLIGIPWRVAFALQADGWYLRQDIIWAKPNPMPESVADRCTKAHEYVFLLSKSPKYYFDSEAIKEPATSTDNSNRNRDITKLNNTPGRTRMAGLTTNHYTERNRRSVWTVATKPYKESHFATFPEKLIEPMVLAGAKEGDTVLDPFMGAGTTALVAKKLGRKYAGIDLNPDYIKIAEKRLVQEYLF